MYACKVSLVFKLHLNIEEISYGRFKLMGAGMLNTQVPILAKQLLWVLKDGQLYLKIPISKGTINHLFFSELW